MVSKSLLLSHKEYTDNAELISDLKKFIINYNKNNDFFDLLKDHKETAIRNSLFQKENDNVKTSTDVVNIVDKVIKYKE